MIIFPKSHDFSEIFSTLIFHLKLCGDSADFTIFAPFGAFLGPSGPLFSMKLDGRYCIFQEITFNLDFFDFSLFLIDSGAFLLHFGGQKTFLQLVGAFS